MVSILEVSELGVLSSSYQSQVLDTANENFLPNFLGE